METARFYINNSGELTKRQLEGTGITMLTAQVFLRQAIVFNICSESEMQQIVRIARSRSIDPMKQKKLDLYEEMRKIYIARTKDLEQLSFQLQTLEAYGIEGEGPRKTELEKRIAFLEWELYTIRKKY